MRVLTEPHPLLSQKAETVQDFDQALAATLDQMLLAMYDSNGIGLAGPQVGVMQRILVADWDPRLGPIEMVNPRIVSDMGQLFFPEGCLSLPGITVVCERFARITVESQDRNGMIQQMDLQGLGAVVIQHEMDHLEGKTLLSRMNRVERRRYLRKARKAK